MEQAQEKTLFVKVIRSGIIFEATEYDFKYIYSKKEGYKKATSQEVADYQAGTYWEKFEKASKTTDVDFKAKAKAKKEAEENDPNADLKALSAKELLKVLVELDPETKLTNSNSKADMIDEIVAKRSQNESAGSEE